ncbi:MAG: hypothetical protein RJA07_1774 [Bacteroidota bacterium]|jgi:putative addiction module component (TIGR02574 family)
MNHLKEILQLSVDERIHMVETIWDSIEKDAISDLTESQKQLINERLEAYENNPTLGSPWSEVKNRIQNKLENTL